MGCKAGSGSGGSKLMSYADQDRCEIGKQRLYHRLVGAGELVYGVVLESGEPREFH